MTEHCPHMLPGCAERFARLDERVTHATEWRRHSEEERDRERDSLTDSLESLAMSVRQLQEVVAKLTGLEDRMAAVEAAVVASTTRRATLAGWWGAMKTFSPFVLVVASTGATALVTATLWAVKHGLVTP